MSRSENPWDERFASVQGFMYGEAPNAWIASQLPQLPKGASVLAVAEVNLDEGSHHQGLAQVINIKAVKPVEEHQ